MIDLDTVASRRCDPDLLSPGIEDERAIERARRVCARCPIRLDCLAFALRTPAMPGFWGGLTERERSAHR